MRFHDIHADLITNPRLLLVFFFACTRGKRDFTVSRLRTSFNDWDTESEPKYYVSMLLRMGVISKRTRNIYRINELGLCIEKEMDAFKSSVSRQ